jgi:hypothetical protein
VRAIREATLKRKEADALSKDQYIEIDPEMLHLLQVSNRVSKGKLVAVVNFICRFAGQGSVTPQQGGKKTRIDGRAPY